MYSILPSLQTKHKKIHSRTFTCDRTSWISDGLEGNKWITITVMASLWRLVPAQVIHSLIDNKSLQAPNKCLHHLKGPQKKSQGVEISHGFLWLFLFFSHQFFCPLKMKKPKMHAQNQSAKAPGICHFWLWLKHPHLWFCSHVAGECSDEFRQPPCKMLSKALT